MVETRDAAIAENTSTKKQTHPNLILAICCMSLLVVGMDVTIVNVALPAIQRDLHATVSGLQWILDAYTLAVATLLMLAGSVSDRVGRRRVFQIGLLVFTAGSLLCSLAHSIGQLVAMVLIMVAYVLFGVGLGMVNPAITNNAVAGMPLSQAGVAAAIASTGRQVGAALGVAVAGTVVSASHARGSEFTRATHPIWWIMTGCGAIILVLGWVSSTPWAHANTGRVASLLSDPSR